MTTKSTKPKPLTVSDYLLFNEMISRIRTLEHVATERFMEGKVDRPKFAITLGKQVDRLQTKILPAYGKCRYPYCSSGGVCDLCSAQAAREQLAQILAGLNSNNT